MGKIVIKIEGIKTDGQVDVTYGEQSTEWVVDDEYVRSYSIAYEQWISRGHVEITRAIIEAIKDGITPDEIHLGAVIIEAASAKKG